MAKKKQRYNVTPVRRIQSVQILKDSGKGTIVLDKVDIALLRLDKPL